MKQSATPARDAPASTQRRLLLQALLGAMGMNAAAASAQASHALDGPPLLRFSAQGAAAVHIASAGRAAPLLLDPADTAPVLRAAGDWCDDCQRVSGARPERLERAAGATLPAMDDVLVLGSLGRSHWVDDLARRGLIDTAALRGRWEGLLIQTVEQPWPGVQRALVLAGSDPRGAVYALYTLSEQIGVSPWYWWADVPVQRQAELAVPLGTRHSDAPVVRWRGIFLNDEVPALSSWVREFHGGYTHSFYARVFELLLRLRANLLWPAMWASAFYADDPQNGPTADRYGIVMSTSHHEPMLLAQREWRRRGPLEQRGPWDYTRNRDALRDFWAIGAKRAAKHESLVTIGMRGDGDEPMAEGTPVKLLEYIINEQRGLIAEAAGRPDALPQVLALYKEVQAYFEQGLQVPDDVLLLWADDNWGHIRRLPTAEERQRSGGAGIYYHFDYVGGPRSYRWLNVTQLPQVWEQMHLASEYGASRLWIANVGDLKPMEVPMEFFLRMAWKPAAMTVDALDRYLPAWATREFGAAHAAEAAALVAGYTRMNVRRKPELLDADTYSLLHEHEAERLLAEWNDLRTRAEKLLAAVPPTHRDACFQLVVHPVLACANLHALYEAVARNRLYASQGRASASLHADRARRLFAQDAEITRRYHEDLSGGKWRHLMSQTHIGYTSWDHPKINVLPALAEVQTLPQPALGCMTEGGAEATLPAIDSWACNELRTRWFDLFNRGLGRLDVKLQADVPWLRLSTTAGTLDQDLRVEVRVDFSALPMGRHRAQLQVEGSDGTRLQLVVPVVHAGPLPTASGHLQANGVVAIEAAHTVQRQAPQGHAWREIPGLGRTQSGLTPLPVTGPLPMQQLALVYTVHLQNAGPQTLHCVLSPTLNIQPGPGLRYAVALDDEAPQIVNVHLEQGVPEHSATWSRWVKDGVMVHSTRHHAATAGAHTLRFWAVDPALVLQRLVLDGGGLLPSYLGPPESARVGA